MQSNNEIDINKYGIIGKLAVLTKDPKLINKELIKFLKKDLLDEENIYSTLNSLTLG
jgi:hypothetical protein